MVGATLLARLETAGVAPGQQRRQGHTTAQALAEGEDIGANAVQLLGQQSAAAADASLHFVEDQQHTPLAAHALGALQVVQGGRDHTGFALYRFQHHGHSVFAHRRSESLEVVVRHLGEARHLGLEQRLECRLAGG
ncbi:hypothetical protein D3C76_714160 [compost metagenome]